MAKKRVLRRTEVLRIYYEVQAPPAASWHNIKFHQLKRGDIFKLYDTLGNAEVPDEKYRGHHVVNVALDDAKYSHALNTWAVNCIPVRGFKE